MLTAEGFESALRRHVLDVWFPRCLDLVHGGFLCDFDRTWSPAGPHNKLLEFQARQCCVAADGYRRYPDDEGLRTATQHGFQYLREVMWDTDAGGWFHLLDRAGRPLEGETKHAHGVAYAVDACVAVFEATGDPTALELAQEGFRWLDRGSRDREHGGYFGMLHRNGSLIRERSSGAWDSEIDSIGTPLGLKDLNVQSDLLETFIRLYLVWPDPMLSERVAEMVDVVAHKMQVPSLGVLHFYVTADWQPIPHLARSGYQFQAAYRLTMAADLTERPQELRQSACRLVDHAIRYARAPEGGFYYASPGVGSDQLGGCSLTVKEKSWWVQVEGLKALLAMSRIAPERVEYLQEFEALWRYVQGFGLDQRHGGFYSFGLDASRRLRRILGPRFAPAAVTRKGDVWKDARHEARALMYCIEMLREKEAAVLPV